MKKFYVFIFSILLSVYGAEASYAYEKSYIGDQVKYRAKFEDTFVHLARDYNLGFTEMRAANPGIDPWVPGEGTRLILPTRHLLPDAPREGIVINIPEMRLFTFLKDEEPTTYPLGVGREGLETPVGTTKIVRKTEGPTWRPTARMREDDPELPESVPPGPENPLGTHALYLGWPLYAIHGTNRPFGIGRRISSGCIRLYPEDIKQLYKKIPVGTKVTVVNQPIKVGWIDKKLYLEAHPSLESAIEMEESGRIKSPKLTEEDMSLILNVAGKYKDRLRWSKIKETVRQRRGYPVVVAYGGNDPEIEEQEPEEIEEEVTETLEKIYEGESEEQYSSNNNYSASRSDFSLNQ